MVFYLVPQISNDGHKPATTQWQIQALQHRLTKKTIRNRHPFEIETIVNGYDLLLADAIVQAV